jgi:hypothetical protein
LLALLGCTVPNPAFTLDDAAGADGGGARDSATAERALPPADTAPPPDVALSGGTGLRGDYYDGVALELGGGGALERRWLDATVDFGWGLSPPFNDMDEDTFSIRWTGQVRPRYSETYTFSTTTDDGVRLWVNGVLLIDRWVRQSSATHSATIALTAYRRYDIKMEYFEETQEAEARLFWSSPSQRFEIVPKVCLFPPPSP